MARRKSLSQDDAWGSPKRADSQTDLDITPMIDVTFLLLIFFMVTSTMQSERELDVPPARHGMGAETNLATVIEILVIVWGLKKTAQLGKRYGGQVLAGLMIAGVGAVLILGFSLIWATVFTDAAEVTAAMQADAWADAGMSEEQIDELLVSTAPMRTPLAQAIFGSIATVVTGLVVSLIAAIFIRQKDA